MGIYLNPNNVLLKRDLNSPIYIDKSLLIAERNKTKCHQPRLFLRQTEIYGRQENINAKLRNV